MTDSGDKLENFYASWSSKGSDEISMDVAAAFRKADILISLVPDDFRRHSAKILDLGCGYGGVAKRFTEVLQIQCATGVDFSDIAIDEARRRFASKTLQFHKLPSLNCAEIASFLNQLIPDGVDYMLLVDILEHIPDCKKLFEHLAPFTKYFIIKLPVECAVFDNYILPKEYPSSRHSNGHLREFDANNVHYFIRELGLTPLAESLYIYHLDDMFPPIPLTMRSAKRRIIRLVLRAFKTVMTKLLPPKIFLRLIGGGGYICLATYNSDHVLTP